MAPHAGAPRVMVGVGKMACPNCTKGVLFSTVLFYGVGLHIESRALASYMLKRYVRYLKNVKKVTAHHVTI